jgi:hypothetical protein
MQMIDVLKRLAELDSNNPNIVYEGQASPELQQLLAMQQKYRGTPHQQQLDKRVAVQQWRDANGKGAPVDATGRPVPVLGPEEFQQKNPNFLKPGTAPAPSGNTNWLVTPDEAKASQDEEARLANLKECGPMGMPSEVEHHTPASINMTADSGPELSGMLADIMKLAGVHQVEPEHLGIEHDPVVVTAMPGMAVGGAAADHEEMGHDHSDSVEVVDEPSDMRRMMDMMNPDMDDEVDESGYNNTPNDPNEVPEFDPEIYANQENQPGGGDRMDGNMPKAYPTMEERLMADWQHFMTEGVAEGDSGAKYRVKSVGNKINPATGERCDFYVNPITDNEVFCKPGQKVKVGDHVTPSGTVKPKV